MLSVEEKKAWQEEGLLHLRGAFDGEALLRWTDELAEWPETAGKWMKYFEEVDGERKLCRVENFLPYHEGWRGVVSDPFLAGVLADAFGEAGQLFKEKINFKLPGGSGFAAHQDAPAFASFGQSFHITAMVSIDPSTVANGCLEVACGQHAQGLMEMTSAQVLSEGAIESLEWVPLETDPGDLVIFGSYLPHRSGPNTSEKPRRAAYLTYNASSDGDFRDQYYASKRAVFPPEIEREPGKDYSNTGLYNIGNPIQS